MPDVNDRPTWSFRDVLASAVFVISTAGIVFVAYLYIRKDGAASREVFSTIVPLFGTWVGTLMAFYFSRENFEAANASLRKVVDQLTPDQKSQEKPVREVMIPRNQLKGIVQLSPIRQPKDITIDELIKLAATDKVSRLLILNEDGSLRHVVHVSMIFQYVGENALKGPPIDPEKTTLDDFLKYKTANASMQDIVSRLSPIPLDAKLRDARDAMLKVTGAQDVVVTKTGKLADAAEGYLTNVDIAKHLSTT